MTEERFKEILDAFLGDADLITEVNQATSWEEGFECAAKKIEGLSFDEWNQAMQMIRESIIRSMG